MSKMRCLWIVLLLAPFSVLAGTSAPFSEKDAIENLNFSVQQYTKMIRNIDNNTGIEYAKKCETDMLCVPRAQEHGKILADHPNAWTVGFYPGVFWMLLSDKKHITFKDKKNHQLMFDKAILYSDLLIDQAKRSNTHDLGMMIDFPLTYALENKKLPKDKKSEYLNAIETGRKNLASRFSPEKGVIKSWDWTPSFPTKYVDPAIDTQKKAYLKLRNPWTYPVIVDNMMNLEYLMKSNDENIRQMGFSHANQTAKHHFHYEDSDTNKQYPLAYHVFDYGEYKPGNWQGLGHKSAWARGQGWALYGFVISAIYADTHKKETKGAVDYQAMVESLYQTLAKYLAEDKVPLWDFFASRSDAYAIAANTNPNTARYSRILNLCIDHIDKDVLPYQGYGPITFPAELLNDKSLSKIKGMQSPYGSALLQGDAVVPCGKEPYYLNNREIPRDTSAAALYAAALYRMAGFTSDKAKAKKYENLADEVMKELTEQYRTDRTKSGSYDLGFVLNSATGHLPNGSEIDTPIVYADYFFIEANLNKLRLN